MTPSPIIELNRAVAVAMSAGYQQGLDWIDKLKPELDSYYLFHAARGDLLRRLEQWQASQQAYTRALELCDNDRERNFLTRRVAQINQQL